MRDCDEFTIPDPEEFGEEPPKALDEMQELGLAWPRAKSWWDDLVVPDSVLGHRNSSAHAVADWVHKVSPYDQEHDYVLYTDGSGCINGWGGFAAVIEELGLDHFEPAIAEERKEREAEGEAAFYRTVVDRWVHFGGTYGSTVTASELHAMVSGVEQILSRHCEKRYEDMEETERWEATDAGGVLRTLTGNDRVSIKWYTDRADIAAALLFNEDGDTLTSRTKNTSLWMRFSNVARHVCITPQYVERNTVPGQKVSDALCGIARERLLTAETQFEAVTADYQTKEQWKAKKSQKAQF